jgi:hypothetical protein
MSMGHGILSVCGDYEGDLHRIVEVLNEWEWDSENEIRFSVHDDCICTNITLFDATYPTAFPSVCWMAFEDGTRVKMNEADEALERRNDWTEEFEDITLSTISALICPVLRYGTLELYAKCREKESEWWERLIIRHGGLVERKCQTFEHCEVIGETSEKHEPGNGSLSRLMRGEMVPV